eukprot:15367143-Ditylum_brightwellii.AAC.2
MSEITRISKHYLPVRKLEVSHIKKVFASDISQLSDEEVLAFVVQKQTAMEHHLWDITFRANESVQSIMAEALLKLQIKRNNKPIKNMKQYRVTVAAFDCKPFWHKEVVNDFMKEKS